MLSVLHATACTEGSAYTNNKQRNIVCSENVSFHLFYECNLHAEKLSAKFTQSYDVIQNVIYLDIYIHILRVL